MKCETTPVEYISKLTQNNRLNVVTDVTVINQVDFGKGHIIAMSFRTKTV